MKRIKQITIGIIAALLMLMLPMSVSAAEDVSDAESIRSLMTAEVNSSAEMIAEINGEVKYSGTCGDNLTWQLYETGLLYISGTGSMKDYYDGRSTSSRPWQLSSVKSVIIDDGVITIGVYAFYDCKNLSSVTIGNSVTTIGMGAFDGCINLSRVTIGNSVTTIVYSAFYGCENLSSISLGNSVSFVGTTAFDGCTRLTAINVDSNNPNYTSKDGVLFNKSLTTLVRYPQGKVSDYTIPNTVNTISNGAFYDCPSLTSISIPNSVKTIDHRAFYSCTALLDVNLPESVNTIGNGAFSGCTGFIGIDIPASVTSIGIKAFENCKSLIYVDIPDSVKTIGNNAFANCTCLESVTIPDSVTSLDSGVFSGCRNLVTASIGNSVPAINSNTFQDCRSLESVIIGDSVRSIGSYAFDGCSSLQGVTMSVVMTIDEYAFQNCKNLTTVNLPNSIREIGSYAFYECNNLSNITFPRSLQTIGQYAFYNCKNITINTIPNSVTSVGSYAFYGCTGIKSMTIGNSVGAINERSFSGCSNLESVTIGNSVTSIGTYAFISCINLKDVKIGNYVTSIGDRAFSGCRSLVSIDIPSSVISITDTYIGGPSSTRYDPFIACSSLVSINVDPNNTTYASKDGVLFNKSMTELRRCPQGKSGEYTIPDTVTSISSYAFYYCNKLTDIIIPSSVKSIGTDAFIGCTGLEKIYADNGTAGQNYANNNNISTEQIHASGVVDDSVLKLDKTEMHVVVNKSVTLNAALNKKIISNEQLSWYSDNEAVAKVSASGKVTGVSDGVTTIYAKSDDNHVAKCNVTVTSVGSTFSIDASDFDFGIPVSGKMSGPQVDFLGKKFDLFQMDVGWNLDLKYASCKYDEQQQKLILKVGKLRDYPDEIKDDKLWLNEYYEIKDFTKAVFGGKTSWNKYEKMRSLLKKHKAKIGFEFDTAVYGYLEFDCSSGEAKFCEGGLAISSTTNASIKYYPVPILYAKFGIKGEVEAKGGINYLKVADSDPKITVTLAVDFSVTPSISAGAGVGIGSFSIASIEAGTKGELKTSISNDSLLDESSKLKITFQGSIFLEAKLIGFISPKWERYGTEYVLYPPQTDESSVLSAQSLDDTDSADTFRLVDRTTIKKVRSVSQNFVDNVYPYSEPQLLELANGNVLAVWIDDDNSRSDINRTALMYSLYSNGSWSGISQVNNDGTPDYSPKLIASGEGAYLVWQNADEPLADDMTMLQSAEHYDISVSYFDGTLFGEVENVNSYDNSTLEIQPLLITNGDKLTSVWVESSDNYMYGENAVFTICKAEIGKDAQAEVSGSDTTNVSSSDVSSTNVRKIVVENISNLSVIDAAYYNGNEYILYSTSDNNNIHFIKNGQESVINAMSSNFKIVDGKIYWFTDAGVKFAPLDNLDSITDTQINFGDNVSNIKFINNSNGNNAIIWKQTEELKSELYVSYYDSVNKTWGQGICVTDCNSAITDYSAILDNENKISYVMQTREVLEDSDYPYGTANLVMNSYNKVTDIQVSEIYFESAEILPNNNVKFSTSVENIGTETIDSVKVDLVDGDGNVLGTTNITSPIIAGNSIDAAVSYTLPSAIDELSLKMVATVNGGSDVNTSNNTTEEVSFVLPNLLFESVTAKTTDEGAEVAAVISNNGYSSAQNITVSLHQQNSSAEPINTQTINILNAGNTSEIKFKIDIDMLTANEDPYLNQFALSISSESNELLYADNNTTVQVESVRVSGLTLNKNTLELARGNTEQLTAAINPTGAIDQSIKWYSTDVNVAVVDEKGLISAVNEGSADIIAISSDGSYSATCTVTVKVIKPVINENTLNLYKGDYKKINVSIDGRTLTETEVVWNSSDTTVAIVESNGTVKAIGEGNAEITCIPNDKSAAEVTCSVTVLPLEIKLDKSSVKIYSGTTETLKATLKNKTTTTGLIWSSSNTSVATVDSTGQIKGIASGTATITCSDSSGKALSASCNVIVYAAPTVKIELDGGYVNYNFGTELSIYANYSGGVQPVQYKFYYEHDGLWNNICDYSSDDSINWLPLETGTYNIYVDAKDAMDTITADMITINVNSLEKNLTASIQSPQPAETSIILTATGGSKYKFYTQRDDVWTRIQDTSESNTCTWKPTTAGEYVIYVDIMDESGEVITCITMDYEIISSFTATIKAAYTSPQKAGTTIKLTVNAAGGQGELKYKFYSECNGVWTKLWDYSENNTYNWHATTVGTHTVYCDVMDESGAIVCTLFKYEIVEGEDFVADLNANRVSGQLTGTEIRLMADSSNGTGEVQYKFYIEKDGVWTRLRDYDTQDYFLWMPTEAGFYNIYVDAKDADGNIASKRLNFTVEEGQALSIVSLTANPSSANVGEIVTLTGTTSGGSGTVTYKFYYEVNGTWVRIQDFSENNTCTFTPSKAGTYHVYMDAIDDKENTKCQMITYVVG